MAGPLLDRFRGTVEANPAAPAFIFQGGILTRGQVLALYHETTRLLRERGIRAVVTNWDFAGVDVPVRVKLDTLSVQEDAPEPDAGEGADG